MFGIQYFVISCSLQNKSFDLFRLTQFFQEANDWNLEKKRFGGII